MTCDSKLRPHRFASAVMRARRAAGNRMVRAIGDGGAEAAAEDFIT
jgi:hypothetical protein